MSYGNEMSPADYAAINNGGFGGFGGDGAWWIIILLLFGWGGRGFGNGGGCATTADVAAGFNNSAVLGNLNDLALGQASIQQTLCQGFGGVASQLAQCCCDNKAAIADVKYTIATENCDTRHAIYNSSRDIIDNANANSRAILDVLNANYIRTLEQENNSLRLSASQSAQNAVLMAAMDANKAEILRRTGAECPTAAYIVQPPTPVTFPTCGQYAGCGAY